MTEQRLIDANTFAEAWNRDSQIGKTMRAVIAEQPTIDPETLPIVRQLREELTRVTAERNEYKELFFSYKHVCGGVDPKQIEKLVEADKDGRCFVSDVKLGGKVFYIPKFNGKPYCGIREGHVQALSFTKAGKRIKIREYHAHNQDFMLGKTVFLTHEAAEAALKGEQHERG